jgi:PST family polysaccharide transporter
MDDGYFLQVKNKIIAGVFALTARTFILQIIASVSTFILAILLTPEIFGIYYVVTAIISFLSYFSDIGLAAALIQKKEEPTRDELVTTFTIQQILIGTIVGLTLYNSTHIAVFFKLNSGGLFLLQSLIISFFLSSLKTIPSVLLERKLDFQKLVIPQILETGVFYSVIILSAVKGFGVYSFAWGALGRGVVGLIAIYIISPWKISLGLSFGVVKRLLVFGVPFQMNSLLALVKDDLMTIFLGKILPFAQVGYIGWAKRWAEIPLRLIMDNVIRVTFPAYSRLSDNKEILGKALEKSIFFISLLVFPAYLILIMMIIPMMHIIPRLLQWEPAVFSFYLFSLTSIMAAFSSPVVNALNALGYIKSTLVLMVIWTILTWILVPILVFTVGWNGVPVAAFIIGFTSFMPFIIIRKYLQFRLIKPLIKPAFSTLIIGIPLWLFSSFAINIISVVILLVCTGILYLLCIFILMKEEVLPYIPKKYILR